MAEQDKPDSSGLELDFSSRTPAASNPSGVSGPRTAASSSGPRSAAPSPSGTSGPRSAATTSNPRMQAVRSASRLEPVVDHTPKAAASARLREGAVDTIFNSATILADVVDDFRRSDKYFKYKALVLFTWLLMSVSSFAVACPGQGPSNDIGATLVVSGESGKPVYMVKNESQDVWQDVEVVVNGQYRSTLGQVEKNGGSITLSAAVLYDAKGDKAPKTLAITDIEVHVTEPGGDAILLKGGVAPK